MVTIEENWNRLLKYWRNKTDKKDLVCTGATDEQIESLKKLHDDIPESYIESLRICNSPRDKDGDFHSWLDQSDWGILYDTKKLIEFTNIDRQHGFSHEDGMFEYIKGDVINPKFSSPKEWVLIYDWNTDYTVAIDMLSSNKGQIIVFCREDSSLAKWTDSYEEWFELAVDEVLKYGELRVETIEAVFEEESSFISKEYWKELIVQYKEQPIEYPMEYGDWMEPYSGLLMKIHKSGEIVNSNSISDDQISEYEAKLNVKLPPSYLEFLKYTNGMLLHNSFVNLLPLENIDWFYTLNKEWVDIWNEDEDDISDEKYFIYGEKQDTCWMRNKYLKAALQISDSCEGDVLLLNPEVKFGDEWEAWYFSNALAGAMRFRSFKELMEYFLLPQETEEIPQMTDEEYELKRQEGEKLLKHSVNTALKGIAKGMLLYYPKKIKQLFLKLNSQKSTNKQ